MVYRIMPVYSIVSIPRLYKKAGMILIISAGIAALLVAPYRKVKSLGSIGKIFGTIGFNPGWSVLKSACNTFLA